jgi:hypothetical protein
VILKWGADRWKGSRQLSHIFNSIKCFFSIALITEINMIWTFSAMSETIYLQLSIIAILDSVITNLYCTIEIF